MLTFELSSIRIDNFDLDKEGNIFQLHQLYKDVLIADDWWHFFREGEYTLVRCASDIASEVVDYLVEVLHMDRDDITVTQDWVDNIKPTRDNQTAFTYIFHGFSILAMTILEDDKNVMFDAIFDRVIHCFLNMARQVEKFEDVMPFIPGQAPGNINHAMTVWEAMKICHNALMRTYTIGRHSGVAEAKQVIKNTEAVKDA